MITKTIKPDIDVMGYVTGTTIKYRFLGITLYKKVLYNPPYNLVYDQGDFVYKF